jgi:ribosomal protein L4
LRLAIFVALDFLAKFKNKRQGVSKQGEATYKANRNPQFRGGRKTIAIRVKHYKQRREEK